MSILTQDWTRNRHRGPLDLRNTLILVPTRHAGRRLRAELARTADARGSAVLAGRIVTPEHLIPLPPDAAPDALVLALLARRLLDQHAALPALFPNPAADWTFAYALGFADQLQDVRRQLAEADRAATDMPALVPDEEKDRWADIAKLEKGLLQDLAKLKVKDSLQARREAARQLPAALPFSRVVSLFVPDLSPLAARTLESFSVSCEVHLHILAPASEADRFDAVGRPLPDRWENESLPIPENQIHVFDQAPDETETLAELLATAEREQRALAVCTPDPDNARALARRLQIDDLPLFLPNGVPLSATAPGRLLAAWLALLRQPSYAATAAFLRHPDAQDFLSARLGLDHARDLLAELDACQTRHLPATFDDLLHFAAQYPLLLRALEELQASFAAPLPTFLADLYDCRNPSSAATPDPLFAEAATALAALVQATDESARRLRLARHDALDLLQAALPREQVFPKPDPATPRETTGWLEVQWETSPALLLADLREGVVPETRIGDAFLPDSLRVRAGLAGNRDAFARDLFLARALLASRPPGGVRFLYSRRAANQDPQLPSRILLACPGDELPARVALLFERPALHAPRPAAPDRPILQLAPPACPPERIPSSLSVTAFSAYLACPFRFYLSRILRMNAADDSARELDPMGFGSLAHEALALLNQHPLLDDDNAIAGLLIGELDRLARKQFGARPALAILVQLDSLRQRLRAAAAVHAASVRDGWRIIAAEEQYETELDGLLLRARLDRIDRHVDGRIRILDYKTTDAGLSPRETHYQPRNKAWADLQLPLYRFLYEQLHPQGGAPPPPGTASRPLASAAGSRPPPPPDGSRPPPPCAEGEQRSASGEHRPPPQISVGYFNLPKAATDTRIEMFDLHPKDGDLYPSALAAARTVIAAIRAGRFWPPAELRPDHDDFALLFAGGAGLIQEPPA